MGLNSEQRTADWNSRRLSFGDITFAVIRTSAISTSVTDLYDKFEHYTIYVNVNLVVS